MDWRKLGMDMMRKTAIVYVSTINSEGFPETRAMFNLINEEQYPGLEPFFRELPDFTVYLSSNTSSRKVAQIRSLPQACAYYSLPEQWFGLNLIGRLEEVKDEKIKRSIWQPGWEMYYPKGWEDPDYAVLRLNPHEARCYYQLQTCNFEI
ncbi:MAG: pyridoxamine 5'-phosphate oxidase family protein [Syntrophomonas sp.]